MIDPSKLPMSHRIVSMTKPVSNVPSLEIFHQSVINQLRPYSAASIADLTLQMMWWRPKDPVDELRAAPWLTLLLLRWALQDNRIDLYAGRPVPVRLFDKLRQDLWTYQGQLSIPKQDGNIWLMLRTIFHVQSEFQRKESWDFFRWPALYARLNTNNKSRKQFLEVIGMEPEIFMDLTYSLCAAVVNREMPLGNDWLSPLRKTYGDDVDKIYSLFVGDLKSIRSELQKNDDNRKRSKQELYEFPRLKNLPLVRLANRKIHCWHPLVFARGIEDAIHIRLSELGQEYSDLFSRVFEDYVTELAISSKLDVLPESSFKALMGGHAPSVEAVLKGDDCNIFVEAKMSLFADDVILQDNQTLIFQKTKRLRSAIIQGWRVSRLIRQRSDLLGSKYSAKEDFLLVVTSRDLIVGGGEALTRLYSPDAFKYPDAEAERYLPMSNIFIISIEDFENLIGCVVAGEINLSTLLKECALANKHGDSARMFFSQFLSKYTDRWTQSDLISKAIEASGERLKLALS